LLAQRGVKVRDPAVFDPQQQRCASGSRLV
jgi:hypothetical protein